jgi:hypothetical protein
MRPSSAISIVAVYPHCANRETAAHGSTPGGSGANRAASPSGAHCGRQRDHAQNRAGVRAGGKHSRLTAATCVELFPKVYRSADMYPIEVAVVGQVAQVWRLAWATSTMTNDEVADTAKEPP